MHDADGFGRAAYACRRAGLARMPSLHVSMQLRCMQGRAYGSGGGGASRQRGSPLGSTYIRADPYSTRLLYCGLRVLCVRNAIYSYMFKCS